MRMITNVLKTILYLLIAALVGYYNFGVNGFVGLATNLAFGSLGILMVLSWKNPQRSCCDHSLEMQSLRETNTNVDVAGSPAETDNLPDQANW